jgi:predicted DNA-binding transcriptional regulator AlpA
MTILTIEQVSELLNVRPSWVYARTCDGTLRGTGRGRRASRKSRGARRSPIETLPRIPHFKAGRLLRFDRDEVLTWFQKMHRSEHEPSSNKPEGGPQAVESSALVDGR